MTFWAAVPFVAAGICALAVLVALVVVAAFRAPLGYEDDAGFHYGTPADPVDEREFAAVIRGPWRPRPVQDADVDDGAFAWPSRPQDVA